MNQPDLYKKYLDMLKSIPSPTSQPISSGTGSSSGHWPWTTTDTFERQMREFQARENHESYAETYDTIMSTIEVLQYVFHEFLYSGKINSPFASLSKVLMNNSKEVHHQTGNHFDNMYSSYNSITSNMKTYYQYNHMNSRYRQHKTKWSTIIDTITGRHVDVNYINFSVSVLPGSYTYRVTVNMSGRQFLHSNGNLLNAQNPQNNNYTIQSILIPGWTVIMDFDVMRPWEERRLAGWYGDSDIRMIGIEYTKLDIVVSTKPVHPYGWHINILNNMESSTEKYDFSTNVQKDNDGNIINSISETDLFSLQLLGFDSIAKNVLEITDCNFQLPYLPGFL